MTFKSLKAAAAEVEKLEVRVKELESIEPVESTLEVTEPDSMDLASRVAALEQIKQLTAEEIDKMLRDRGWLPRTS